MVLALLAIQVAASAEEGLRLYHVVDVEQGGNATVMAGADAVTEAELPVSVSLGCCRVEAPGAVKVRPGADNLFVVRIHASLKEEPGHYTLSVTAGSAGGTIGVNVKTSDLVQRLPGLIKYADSLRSMAEEYEGGGMEDVKAMLDSVSDGLAAAGAAVEADDAAGLRGSLFFVEKKLYYEIPLKMNSVKNIMSLYNLIWIPVVILVAGLALILLKVKP